jgi:hypothetical protein
VSQEQEQEQEQGQEQGQDIALISHLKTKGSKLFQMTNEQCPMINDQ